MYYVVFGGIVYVLVVILSIHMSLVSNRGEGQLINAFSKGLDRFFNNPLQIFPITSHSFIFLPTMSALFLVVIAVLWINNEKNRHFDSTKTNGSSQWNTNFKSYNKNFRDMAKKKEEIKSTDNNMIMSENVWLSMDTRKTRRNNNVIIFGGSGTGKSRFIVKPNMLQGNSSFVVTDPSGEILETTGKFLEQEGYKIKVFNLVEMAKSNCYNPFDYIRDEAGVMSLVNCLIQNTTDSKASKGDPFWEKSETALLMAIIFYLVKERPKKDRNFASVMKLLRSADIDEMDPNAKSGLDRIFDDLEKKNKNHIAVKQWKIFKMAGAKTAKSILITAAVRLSAFNIRAVENLTCKDDLELGKIGDEKTALFVIIPVADDTYNFLVSLMYSQLFETLYFHAENECKGKRLSYHVRFMLDEFANIGRIPQFEKKLATMRKYEISCTIILQSISQLKGMYPDDWSGIVGNCDTTIFLGGKDSETNKQMSDDLGDATIVVRNNSRNIGKGGASLSFNRSARKLLDPAEIQKLPNDECIVMIRSLQPFREKKFPYEKHKNYKYTGDASEKNNYVILLNNGESEEDGQQEDMELKKTEAYVEALEHPEDPSKQVIGKPKPMDEVMETIGQDEVTIVDGSPGEGMNVKIQSSEDGHDVWDMF